MIKNSTFQRSRSRSEIGMIETIGLLDQNFSNDEIGIGMNLKILYLNIQVISLIFIIIIIEYHGNNIEIA